MLVELGLVEQRYQAVLEVLGGVTVTEVAGRFGVSRQSVHFDRRCLERSRGTLEGRGLYSLGGVIALQVMRLLGP